MRPVVLDASVGVPLVHVEAGGDRWRSLAAGWQREGRRLIVPAHFWLEISNALLIRHRYSGAEIFELLHALDDVVSETVEPGRATLALAIDRAERFGLTLYDAAYVALAETLDADLATADEALRFAAADRLADDTGQRPLSETRAAYGRETTVTWPDYSGAAAYLASLRARLGREAAAR